MMPEVKSRAVASWVLYDLANTVFSMGVVSLYFPMFVRGAVGVERADRTFGLIAALSMALIFVVSPLLGAMTDRARRRMPFLVTSTLVCVLFTVLLGHADFRIATVWGVLTDRLGPRRTLNYVLRAWMAVFIAAGLVGVLALPMWALYAVTCAAGVALGGVWAADRPYMLRLTPPDRIGEFYGLYGMVGRFSAITGPLIWAGITWITIETLGLRPAVGQGIALFSLLLLLVPGYLILQKVSDIPPQWNRG
jgi:MFS-type transporter involved in bile tolerance (Atg22 family)